MKIIQVNIWGGKLGEPLIDFLRQENPDLVCMQEVNDLKGRSGTKFFSTLDEIKEGAGLQEAFLSTAYSYNYMERQLNYGNAILSKLPLTATKTIFTEGQYKQGFDVTRDDGNIRNLQVATVEIDGQPLHILNHHGHHVKGSKAGDDETMRQMRIITDTIDSLDGPLIFCGDLNLRPDSESLAALNDKLTNLSITNKLETTCNQFTYVDDVIDYIFVNDMIKIRRFEMPEVLVSDHNPLILEFDL